jgi:hypothetical protein
MLLRPCILRSRKSELKHLRDMFISSLSVIYIIMDIGVVPLTSPLESTLS